MTSYENPMEVGLYREETGLTCASGNITVSAPVAQYIHADFQNAPSGDDTFTKGVEWLRNVTDSTWNATDITVVSGTTITIGAGHNGDEFNIGYYAKGSGVAAAAQCIQDGDPWRMEHFDNIYRAINMKGNLNPTECGYVYDQVMAYRSMPIISSSEVTAVNKQEEHTTGTWSFENYHPYYVTSVRVEVDESALQTTKGICIHVYESGTEVVESGGSAGVVLNDQSGWYASEHDDTVDVWYQGNIYLGMMLCDNFKVTVETNGGNTDLSAGDCHVFVSGWHIPDPVNEREGIIQTINQDYGSPTNLGFYRVEVQTADDEPKVRFGDQPIAVYTDDSMRTHPHFRNEFLNGIEYAKNLTTGEFVTAAIASMDNLNVRFSPAHVSEGDSVEVGYYAMSEIVNTYSCAAAGDRVDRGDIDGIILGTKRMDRCDLGATNFPYGDGEFEWDYGLFKHLVISAAGGYFAGSELTTGWQTLLNFDSISYNSREVTEMKFGSDRTLYNETPFFLVGVSLMMDADAVAGGVHTYDRIVLRLTINGQPANQYGQREVYYLPMCQATVFDKAPSPMGTSSDVVADGAGHMFYIPLGVVRSYGFKIDARVEGGDAFENLHYRGVYVEGWIPDDGA